MKEQSDDKIKSTPVPSKDELSDSELNKVTGGGRDSSEPSISEIVITKRLDKASAKLF
jgi:bacteriocin-like protein